LDIVSVDITCGKNFKEKLSLLALSFPRHLEQLDLLESNATLVRLDSYCSDTSNETKICQQPGVLRLANRRGGKWLQEENNLFGESSSLRL
jgi:hypothetical protein